MESSSYRSIDVVSDEGNLTCIASDKGPFMVAHLADYRVTSQDGKNLLLTERWNIPNLSQQEVFTVLIGHSVA